MDFSSFRKRILKHRKFRQLIVGCIIFSLVMGFLIVPIEASHPTPRIRNVSDGLWWSIQTLTTVGYGDVTPVTELGRVLGVVMQLVGAVLFGTVIAIVSSTMSRRQEEFYWERLFERLDRYEARLEEIEKRTGYLVRTDIHSEK